jgi:hypothetical protein
MGVPPQVQEEVMGTSPDKGVVLDDKTVRNYFVGEIPYQQEWRHAKCAQLSPVETQRLDVLKDKIETLTSAEWSEYTPMNKKRDLELACQGAVRVQSRMAAYERFSALLPAMLQITTLANGLIYPNTLDALSRMFQVKNDSRLAILSEVLLRWIARPLQPRPK